MAKLKNQESKELFKKKRKNLEKPKSLGLFDHLNQITKFRDPDYFDNLTDDEKKSFNHFMILKGLSMNPQLLDTISTLYQYSDIIPSPQFYKVLMSLIPPDSTWYPWIKARKEYKEELLIMVSKRFEVPFYQAKEYIDILSNTDDGMKSLVYICQEFGKSNKEIEQLLSNNDNE